MMLPERIGRYLLTADLDPEHHDLAVQFFRGHDEVLDREVSLRILNADDPRAPAFLGAARAAALVEDRRLLRVLDVMTLAATANEPAQIAVVSEWATGRNLGELLQARGDQPIPVDDAVNIVSEVARAVSAGLATNVNHGRLRPSSVIVTDAGEVRVRGLAVDASLWGPLDKGETKTQADVDGLGCLLYLLITGLWSGPHLAALAGAPIVGGNVLLPSRVRADVPRAIDDVIARSVSEAARPRGIANISDASAFTAMLGLTRDHLAPVSHGAKHRGEPNGKSRGSLGVVFRIAGVLIAFAVVLGFGFWGCNLIASDPLTTANPVELGNGDVLTASAVPMPSASDETGPVILPIVKVRSFDPFDDENKDGIPDGKKGRENNIEAKLVADLDITTAWHSQIYDTPDADGKGGVGLIINMGGPQSVRSASLTFERVGAATEVRVADEILPDPQLWSLLAAAPAGDRQIDLRGPRAITGKYVLLWFPQLPQLVDKPGTYQVGLSKATLN